MIIIHGPQGCGKTTYAQALAEHFGCSSIQDDWNGSDAPIGELVLTSSTIKANLSALLDARVIRFDEALRLAGLSPDDALRLAGLSPDAATRILDTLYFRPWDGVPRVEKGGVTNRLPRGHLIRRPYSTEFEPCDGCEACGMPTPRSAGHFIRRPFARVAELCPGCEKCAPPKPSRKFSARALVSRLLRILLWRQPNKSSEYR